jgi:hypothetical protein
MRTSRVPLSLALFLASAGAFPAHAGQEVGNGGDVLTCRPSADNSLEGLLSLDYVLTFDPGGPRIVPAASVAASLGRIRRNLKAKLPALEDLFVDFVDHLGNQDLGRRRIWEKAPFGLVELKDEDLASASRVPSNCREGGLIPIIQAVIRQAPSEPGTIIYKYMEETVAELKRDRPLQLSFLLVHEWLWDVSDNVERNRRLVRYFHSEAFDDHSPQQARAYVRGLGLDPGPAGGLASELWELTLGHSTSAGNHPGHGNKVAFEVRYAKGFGCHVRSASLILACELASWGATVSPRLPADTVRALLARVSSPPETERVLRLFEDHSPKEVLLDGLTYSHIHRLQDDPDLFQYRFRRK